MLYLAKGSFLVAVLWASGTMAVQDGTSGSVASIERRYDAFDKWVKVPQLPWIYQCSGRPADKTAPQFDVSVCTALKSKLDDWESTCKATEPRLLSVIASKVLPGGFWYTRSCGFSPADKQTSHAESIQWVTDTNHNPVIDSLRDKSDREGKERQAVCLIMAKACPDLSSDRKPIAINNPNGTDLPIKDGYLQLPDNFARDTFGVMTVSISVSK